MMISAACAVVNALDVRFAPHPPVQFVEAATSTEDTDLACIAIIDTLGEFGEKLHVIVSAAFALVTTLLSIVKLGPLVPLVMLVKVFPALSEAVAVD